MQRVLSWEKSIREYERGFSTMRTNPPARCRGCGSAKFHKWGSYKRYVVDEDSDYEIPVRRYRCVKCWKTYSYLPSFCLRGLHYGTDLVMKLLSALILKARFVLGEMRRQAYILLRRFSQLESVWLVFLRARGFGSFPRGIKERRVKIFTALQAQYTGVGFQASFLEETGQHFMSQK